MTVPATKVFKNWAAICQLGGKNRLLMLALATLDLEKPNTLTHRLVSALPEYFSAEPNKGPYPLSYIRKCGGENATKQDSEFSRGEDHPVSYDVTDDLRIPFVSLAYSDKELAEYRDWLVPRPEDISIHCSQGDIVEYEGTQMMVLENNEGLGEITLVPAELIDATT